MKTSFKFITLLFAFATLSACGQPIKNARTETVKIYGNCEMCKETIENAAFIKKVAKANWDKDTKMATLTFDSTKTTTGEILKRIAYAGYDNNEYLAPDDAYANLPECCQYSRLGKEVVTVTETHKHADMKMETDAKQDTVKPKAAAPLAPVFDAYFSLKDALVKDDGTTAAVKAKELFNAIDAVKMDVLSNEVHTAWMNYMAKLSADAGHIKDTNDQEKQRGYFVTLSKNMIELIKVARPGYDVYVEHCPMYNNGKGADWLSKEKDIKNPFYGSQMLTCGSVTETIK